MDAAPRWKIFVTHPSAIKGHVSRPRYIPNATNEPTLIVPRRASDPPNPMTTTAPSPASKEKSGCIVAYSFASSMFRRRYSSLSCPNRSISAASCRYARTIRVPVRFSCACVVSVGLGPPIPLASAELSAMKSRCTHRASAFSSRTESSGLSPIRIVEWL